MDQERGLEKIGNIDPGEITLLEKELQRSYSIGAQKENL